MKEDVASRIMARMHELGKNPSSVALEAGLGRSAVRDIVTRRASHPRIDTLEKLTGPLECTLDYLTGATADPHRNGPHRHLWWMDTFIDPDPMAAETGVFRPAKGVFFADSSAAPADEDLATASHVGYRDPRIADWRVELCRVGDNSMREINIVKGDIVTVARPSDDEEIPLSSGLIVLAKQHLSSPSIEEISIRQVSISKDIISLVSRGGEEFAPITFDSYATERESALLPNVYFNHPNSTEILGVVVRVSRDLPISPAMRDISYK
ncbi:helix-turn-helix transcriptional regulator [Rhizobium laguerreae]|uniref:helix-turn-helix transcriptional regulator n=1 Tax=Rhizobium laguerreae TaxID=1076926 RepID=UPI001C8FD6C6|nr:helix-turn-helix transcriptional regulator [Rhizobium laguerreae]MBY3500172.1 helix-turn-helix transcriptional regulator [Rhizobium laguerreae]